MSTAPANSLLAGTQSATTVAAALNSGTAAGCRQVLVQADPDNTVSVFVGNATTQPLELVPGDAATIGISDVAKVFVKTASSTATVNWLGMPVA